MSDHKVRVFFYGSYINPDALAEVDYAPTDLTVARLPGFDIRIHPLANLVPSSEGSVYGVLTTGTHRELERLYDHAEHVLGGRYLPEAVLVLTRDGHYIPALTYISHTMEDQLPDMDYLERIAGPAQAYGFPDWYIEKLRSFAPPQSAD